MKKLKKHQIGKTHNNSFPFAIIIFSFISLLFFGCKREIYTIKEISPAESSKNDMISIQESDFFQKNKFLGGDVTILNATIKTENGIAYKIFDIDAPSEG